MMSSPQRDEISDLIKHLLVVLTVLSRIKTLGLFLFRINSEALNIIRASCNSLGRGLPIVRPQRAQNGTLQHHGHTTGIRNRDRSV